MCKKKKKKEFTRVTVKAKGPAFFLSLRQRGASFPQSERTSSRAPETCPHIFYFSRPWKQGKEQELEVPICTIFLVPPPGQTVN